MSLFAGCAAPPTEAVKVFSTENRPIVEELVRDGNAWSVVCDGPHT